MPLRPCSGTSSRVSKMTKMPKVQKRTLTILLAQWNSAQRTLEERFHRASLFNRGKSCQNKPSAVSLSRCSPETIEGAPVLRPACSGTTEDGKAKAEVSPRGGKTGPIGCSPLGLDREPHGGCNCVSNGRMWREKNAETSLLISAFIDLHMA